MAMVFSQASIFHLYRLALVVSGASGRKFKISDEGDMKALVRFCDRSRDPSIRRQLAAFLSTVEDKQRQQMAAELWIRPISIDMAISA